MIVTHEMNMDLTRRGEMPVLELVQDDKYTRNLKLYLFADGAPWMPPEDAVCLVRFCKADGKGGEYDTLPDGQRAFSVTENCVCIAVAPQVQTCPGLVQMEIRLIRREAELTMFRLILHVLPNLLEQLTGSEDYYRVESFLKRSGWEPNLFLGTDARGDVVAVPPPECQGVTEEGVVVAIERYLTENPMGGGATAEQQAQIRKNTEDIAAIPVTVDASGYTDIAGLRQMTGMVFSKSGSTITLTQTLQGDVHQISVVTIDSGEFPVQMTTGDILCSFTWEGFHG